MPYSGDKFPRITSFPLEKLSPNPLYHISLPHILGATMSLVVEQEDPILGLLEKQGIVELVGDWRRGTSWIGLFIKRLSLIGDTYLVIYNNGKFIDVREFYNEIEPYLREEDNTMVFWENNFEALVYHIILLERVRRGYLILILPYSRTMLSQIENTYLYSFKRALDQAVRKGWRILVINPVIEDLDRSRWPWITRAVVYVEFRGEEIVVNLVNTGNRERLVSVFK
jgi:hypothetical protein